MRRKYIRNISIDLGISAIAWLLSYGLSLSIYNGHSLVISKAFYWLPVALLFTWMYEHIFGAYRMIWRYVSIKELFVLLKITVGTSISLIVLIYLLPHHSVLPRSMLTLYATLLFLGLSSARVLVRLMYEYQQDSSLKNQRILIIGGGSAAEELLRSYKSKISSKHIVSILDDDPVKHGMEIHGVRISGSLTTLKGVLSHSEIDLVIIAIPSLAGQKMRLIYETCQQVGVAVRTVPTLDAISAGEVQIEEIRPVDINDLLSRAPNIPFMDEVEHIVAGKKMLVTGAGGSIGSELVRQLVKYHPSQIVLLDHSEFALYTIEKEISAAGSALKIVPALINIADTDAVNHIMASIKPDIIFHAAAYKHVPLLEHQVDRAIKNNIMGTENLLKAAVASGVSKFVQVSTDKAVKPGNVMGASKRICEMLCQYYHNTQQLNTVIVRFGNVLGSAGSVVPLFKKQLAAGGPITVTDPEMTRFFMTIPEAVSLILKSASIGKGGELFVLDMGEPVKITYLAEKLIELSGKRVGEDIEIAYTGLRPGEKIHEELYVKGKETMELMDSKIFKVALQLCNNHFEDKYKQLRGCCDNKDAAHALLFEMVK